MRFFHIADVHLGMQPDKGCPWSEDRSREIWESFKKVIQQRKCQPVSHCRRFIPQTAPYQRIKRSKRSLCVHSKGADCSDCRKS